MYSKNLCYICINKIILNMYKLDTKLKGHIYREMMSEQEQFSPLDLSYNEEIDIVNKEEIYDYLNKNAVVKYSIVTLNDLFTGMYFHFCVNKKILDGVDIFHYITDFYTMEQSECAKMFSNLSYSIKRLLINELIKNKNTPHSKELNDMSKNYKLGRKTF